MSKRLRIKCDDKLKLRDIDLHTLLLVDLTINVFNDDISLKTVRELCRNEGATLRLLARKVGVSYSKMAKTLESLMSVGIVECINVDSNMKKYKLMKDFEMLKLFLI